MVKLKRFFRREKGTWTLAVITLLMAGFSIWTSNYLFQTRGRSISPFAPESTTLATGCTLNYTIQTNPCPPIDIVGMSIDRSGSMQGQDSGRRKLEWAKEAAVNFVTAVQNTPNANIDISVNSFGAQGNDGTGVLASSFNSTLNIGLGRNYPSIINAINGINHIESGTCIECGLRIANLQVRTGSNDKRVAILISDGKANHKWDGTTGGSPNPRAFAIEEANRGRAQGVQYHVIGYGVGTGIDEQVLRDIAGNTGSYQYKPDVHDWSAAMLQILNNVCQGGPGGPLPTASSTRVPTTTPVATRVPTPTPAAAGTRLYPTGDTYVSSASPNTNFGDSSSLLIDNQPVDTTLVKFDLTTLANRTVNRARLYVYVTNPSPGTISVKNVTSSWLAQSVTFNTKPTLGSTLRSFTAPTVNTWATVDLTSWVNNRKGQNGVSLALDIASSDGVAVNAVTAASNKLYLLIE